MARFSGSDDVREAVFQAVIGQAYHLGWEMMGGRSSWFCARCRSWREKCIKPPTIKIFILVS